MDNVSGHTMNLANSIIGVSILAMPYCFKQCGVLLSIFLLLMGSIITRLACHYLLKSAIMARRKTFEFLAFHVFGGLGKFAIEIGIIGFLLGTCIAFFVVMGDLGPAIVSEMSGVQIGNPLRNSTLIALAVFCVLPMGLLRNVNSLNGVSRITIGFYCCLVFNIVFEALPHIFIGDWVNEVILWRPDGVLQCVPIFSMALACQTQLFEIYQAIPNASLEKMNGVIKMAVNMSTCVYIFVGTFGYIAFFQKPFTGNILLSFTPSFISDVIKIGFVLSLAFSFPLVIFPCRASLYSLLYKRTTYTNLHDGATSNYIPEGKFKLLTLIIVSVSLLIAIMIPSVELVLGIIGSTIGVMICVIFPVTCFIRISPKNTNERIVAQFIFFLGVIFMVLGTYVNLYALEEAKLNPVTEKQLPLPLDLIQKPNVGEPLKQIVDFPTTIKAVVLEDAKDTQQIKKQVKENNPKEIRHEPPQPEEPVEVPLATMLPKLEEELKKIDEKQGPVLEPRQLPQEKNPPQKEPELGNDKQGPVVEPVQPVEEKIEQRQSENKQKNVDDEKTKEKVKINEQDKNDEQEIKKIGDGPKENDDESVKRKAARKFKIREKESKKNDQIDIEAINKEEVELKAAEEKKEKDSNQILIDTIQKQNEVQREIVEQQKKLIEVIQQQQENVNKKDVDVVNEEKVKAVKQIEDIAKKAIESISGQDKKITKEEQMVKDVIKVNEEETEEKKNPEKQQNNEMKMAENGDIEKSRNVDNNKINMEIPIPIALAKFNNVTVGTNDSEVPKKKNLSSTKKTKDESDAKAMRRDILSEDEKRKTRAKRETDEEKIENLSKAVKEVCNEINKITSTEKPLIKMLCKLSEPDVQLGGGVGPEEQKVFGIKEEDVKEISLN